MLLDRSTLPVQGPPGSGKTHSGARMALDLVRAGKRVGVTANSHKVIAHFLGKLLEAAEQERVRVSIIQKPGKDDPAVDHHAVETADTNKPGPTRCARAAANVAAGTTWLWAREDMVGIGRRPVRRRGGPDVAGQRAGRGGQCLVARPAR